jgi:hypothetical protein
MAKKERPLTNLQIAALMAAEATLYGDIKLVPGYGRTLRGLRNRGLIEGRSPHLYLTEKGKAEVAERVGA